jgi:retron-type reverse transcriptase
MKIQLSHRYDDIISVDNLLAAWQEFIVGKKSKPDVQVFSYRFIDNIIALHTDLANRTYRHGSYESFFVNDPKRRHIHKASVRDRLLHHAIYRILYPFFDRTFIHHSYSCRNNKGMHKAINDFRSFAYTASRNHTRTVWVLKCDIKHFFASIDHPILFHILSEYILDKDILHLLRIIIHSFHTDQQPNNGLPLGNLTSQLFANVYMNVFDHWVKHTLKAVHYLRYADDFVFLSEDQAELIARIPIIRAYLKERLALTLHPDKIVLKTIASGVDFLGWVNFTDHRVLRRATRRRMFETVTSYVGMLKHGNARGLEREVRVYFSP